MFKRVFLILIVLSVVFSSFLVVSAAEGSESGLVPIDLLDYGSFNDSGNNYGYVYANKNYQFSYSSPLSATFWYVDIIFEAAQGSNPRTSLSNVQLVGSAGTLVDLTYKHLGDGVWRAYGSLTNRFVSSWVGVRVIPVDSPSYFFVSVSSFNVYSLAGTAVAERGEIQSYNFTSSNNWHAMSSPGIPIGGFFHYFPDQAGYANYSVNASCVNWRSFDYVDFKFQAVVSTIDAITCEISVTDSDEFVKLPFEVSWLNGTAIGPNTYVNISGSSPTAQLAAKSTTYIELRVFIPAEYRSYGSLFIRFSGQYPFEDAASYFQMLQCTGYYNVHDYDPELLKLDQIRLAIENNLSSPPGSDQLANDTAGVVSDQKDSVSSGLDSLGTISRPDIDLDDFDFSAITSSNGMHFLNVMIRPIKENPIVLGIMAFAAILGLYAFIFFGKKG